MVRRVFAVRDGLEIYEEGGRRLLLHLPAGRSAHGDIRGDEADDFCGTVFGGEALEHRVRVLRVADFERPVGLVGSGAIEDEEATRALQRDEARELVAQLAQVVVVPGVEEVVSIEEVERGISHVAAWLRRASAQRRR